MKKLVVFTKKQWKEYNRNVAADTHKLMQKEYQRGVAVASKDVDILVAALATALNARSTDTASEDIMDEELIGSHAFGVLHSNGKAIVHIYPKSLLPEA